MRRQLLFLILLPGVITAYSQRSDTLRITETNINTKFLKDGTHRYLVYFKYGKEAPRKDMQIWTRTIERQQKNDRHLILVSQEWEHKDSVLHTVKSVCDAASLRPITHEFWWRRRGSIFVDFENKSIAMNGVPLTEADTSKRSSNIRSAFKSASDKYVLNWHMDLEVFPTLPYEKGITFLIPFYDPGTTALFQNVAYTVFGSAFLTGYDNSTIDCWLLVHEEKNNKETFWISKKTKEVLKLEQEINGSIYRYKIKLGFSM